MAMYTMLFDGAPRRSPPYAGAARAEELGDRPDRRSLGRSVVGRQWCLTLTAAIFAIVPSGTAAENVAPQPVQYLMLIANHGDQAVEFVGRQGAASSVNSILPAKSQFYVTDSGASWGVVRRNGMPLCGGVISEGVTHVRIDPPAAPAGWIGETIEGFKIKLSADLAGNAGERDAALGFLQGKLREALDLLPAWTHPYARATELWVGLDERNARSAMFHIDPMTRQAPRSVPFDHLHPSMWFWIVIPNIRRFREASTIYPLTLVHEFAHAYHFRALGYFQPDIKRAYDQAMAKLRIKTIEATRDEYEYFAILSEAYLGGWSYTQFPFSREQLKECDPRGYNIVQQAWTGKLAGANGVVTVDCRSQ